MTLDGKVRQSDYTIERFESEDAQGSEPASTLESTSRDSREETFERLAR